MDTLETSLKRQKEVFDSYIANNGKTTNLLPLLERFAKEDGKKSYPASRLEEYLELYIASNRLTEEERALFNSTKMQSSDKVYERGKVLCHYFIISGGNWDFLLTFGAIYSEEDEHITPYTKIALSKYLNFYLNNTKNKKKLAAYEYVKKHHDKYEDILNMNTIADQIALCLEIEISDITLQEMGGEDLAQELKKNEKYRKHINVWNRNLKKLLNDFLISDDEIIQDRMLITHNFSRHSFSEALKTARRETDSPLLELIAQYDNKCSVVENQKVKKISTLLQSLIYGINYNGKIRETNLYDYYELVNMPYDETLRLAQKYFDDDSSKLIANFIHKKTENDAKITRSENRNYMISEYMEGKGWPASVNLYKAIEERYKAGDIIIEMSYEI